MTRPLRSFYAQVSAVFLFLILLLGASAVALSFRSARLLYAEVYQKLNRDYARTMAAELEPLVAEGLQSERVGGAIHYLMVLNPLVEIYILDAQGRVLAYFLHPAERIVRDRVDVAPVREFVAAGGGGLLLGDDPRSAGRMKPFAAAELKLPGARGYVYVILGGEQYDLSLGMVSESYIARAGALTLLIAVIATLVVGLFLLAVLTRRLRSVSEAVRAFERGDHSRRVDARGKDELGALARAFNEMAGTIESDVEKLKAAERTRTELIGNISHDLRSPLASMKAYLETILLRYGDMSEEEHRRLLETSLRNASSLERLVSDLFELSRLESRQVRPSAEAFQLAELAQDVALKLMPRAEEAGIALTVVPCPDLPRVSADIGMVDRVLTNLLDNALRYTPAGGTVRISLCAEAGRVSVEVSDTGPGIDPADLPRVFERFYRADRSRDRRSGGAGLGLAIAKEIVELHHGTLEADSAPGRGARFRFSLSAEASGSPL